MAAASDGGATKPLPRFACQTTIAAQFVRRKPCGQQIVKPAYSCLQFKNKNHTQLALACYAENSSPPRFYENTTPLTAINNCLQSGKLNGENASKSIVGDSEKQTVNSVTTSSGRQFYRRQLIPQHRKPYVFTTYGSHHFASLTRSACLLAQFGYTESSPGFAQ
ncbi:MAG: hypothetical protein WC100_21760 [Sterolibacterium sp.]